jgi:hypothetical protein
LGVISTLATASATVPPLDPGAKQARDELLRELSKPEYQNGKANWAGLIINWIQDWLSSLQIGLGLAGLSIIGWAIVLGIVIIALVIAFLVFGLPRLNRRSRVTGALFGDEDVRDSNTLRDAAERAASAGDFATAIAEEFRAIARGISERGVLSTFPGTTATGFARNAGASFPASATELRAAAMSFDAVRYLGRSGSEAEWIAVRALERTLRAAKPRSALVPA